MNIKNKKPITLLGIIYKILVKIMAFKMQSLLKRLIRQYQTKFLNERYILDNAFIVVETINLAIESNQPMVVVLLVFEMVNDKVECDFLEVVLKAMDFDFEGIKWTRALYKEPQSPVGLNGITSETFKLSRSIGQSCPLVLFSFLFVPNCLSYLLNKDPLVEVILLFNSN